MKFSYSIVKKLLPKVPPIKKLAEALNAYSFEVESVKGDTLEIKLPANRYSDAGSHIGLAREAAAISNLQFKNPVKTLVNLTSGRGLIKVKVQEPALCPRYSARYFELKNNGTSPTWIKKALAACGAQSISEVVDIMNYAMLVTGQPLHAFDADKLHGSIVVRKAKRGETMTTLDNRHVELNENVLLIADERQPLALAGIKGGKAAEVTKATKRIVVEGANFNYVNIWQSARSLKIQTDASARFSHDLSPALVDLGLDLATELLKASGAKLADSQDVYPRKAGEKVIAFNAADYKKLIGAEVDPKTAKKYFTVLGFEFDGKKVRVPAWRMDVESFEDLAEEIARFEGYQKLKSAAPEVAIKPAEEDEEFEFGEKAKNFLVRLGQTEVYNSSFIAEAEAKEFQPTFFGSDAKAVELENPISEDKRYLRKTLFPLLLKNIEENARYYDSIKIFELGKVFASSLGKIKEKMVLGIAIAGKKNPSCILELKGSVDELLKSFGITDFYFEEIKNELRVWSGKDVIGILRFFSEPKKLKSWQAAAAELDAEHILKIAEEAHEFRPLPKYPEVVRDISVVVDGLVRIGSIVQEIAGVKKEWIEHVDLADEYTDEKFGHKQSLTFRIVFRAEERTLSDEEVNKEMQEITSLLKRKFQAEIR